MNKTILQQLYDGEIYPAEGILPKDPDYRKLSHEVRSMTEELEEKLEPEEKNLFEKITETESQLTIMYSFESFSYGFRLATALMADVFSAENDFI